VVHGFLHGRWSRSIVWRELDLHFEYLRVLHTGLLWWESTFSSPETSIPGCHSEQSSQKLSDSSSLTAKPLKWEYPRCFWMKEAGSAARMTAQGIWIFKSFMMILPLLCILAGYLVYRRQYKIDAQFYQKIVQDLAKRREQKP
jgi:hypothetical protein